MNTRSQADNPLHLSDVSTSKRCSSSLLPCREVAATPYVLRISPGGGPSHTSITLQYNPFKYKFWGTRDRRGNPKRRRRPDVCLGNQCTNVFTGLNARIRSPFEATPLPAGGSHPTIHYNGITAWLLQAPRGALAPGGQKAADLRPPPLLQRAREVRSPATDPRHHQIDRPHPLIPAHGPPRVPVPVPAFPALAQRRWQNLGQLFFQGDNRLHGDRVSPAVEGGGLQQPRRSASNRWCLSKGEAGSAGAYPHDQGPQVRRQADEGLIGSQGVRHVFITPGSPGESPFIRSVSGS